jgi:hypothetical protein
VNEHSFIDAVHRHLPAEPVLLLWKINDQYTGGKPDCYYCGSLSDLWIEYKFVKALPKRDKTKITIDLSQLQIDWLSFLDRCSRPVWVVVGAPKQAVVLSIKEALDGVTCAQFKARAITFKELGSRIKEHCCDHNRADLL